jgi:endonuclease/exonuclease/phosphatase (EEP) superfamily protein YafD
MNTDNMSGLFLTSGPPPDVIIILEATANTLNMTNKMLEAYPHQINGLTKRPSHRPMSYMILSRLPILEQSTIPLQVYDWKNEALRFQVKTQEAQEPYTIYAIHTHSPSREEHQKRRNLELAKLGAIIQEDKSGNIIVAGDLNTTPYIPAFRDLLHISGLRYQSYGIFLNPSWPVFTKYMALRIPIDHMLYSRELTQHSKNTKTLNDSDHLAVITQFSQNSRQK